MIINLYTFNLDLVRSKLRLLVVILAFTNTLTANGSFASSNMQRAGDFIQILIPVIAFGTTFHLDDLDGRKSFYKSFAATIALTHGLKGMVSKKRPNGSGGSFPSGHTSAAFQGASFIHKRYGLEYGILGYIGASFTAYSRVESKNHYLEDVLAGVAIGMLSSFYFTQTGEGFQFGYIARKDFYGYSFSKKF